jgi:hypothetical protein
MQKSLQDLSMEEHRGCEGYYGLGIQHFEKALEVLGRETRKLDGLFVCYSLHLVPRWGWQREHGAEYGGIALEEVAVHLE